MMKSENHLVHQPNKNKKSPCFYEATIGIIIYKIKLKKFFICTFILLNFFTHTFASSGFPEPSSIEDYVRTSDLIIVGNIASIDKIHNFYGYQANAAEREAYEKDLISRGINFAFSLGIMMIDLKINVHEIIKSDNFFEMGKYLIYRKALGNTKLVASSSTRPVIEKYIFFMSRNPDDKTYGLISASRQIKVNESESVVRYMVGTEERKVLNGQLDGLNFIQLVRDEVARKNSIGNK